MGVSSFKAIFLSSSYKILSSGDSAITVDFGNVIDEKINQLVLGLFHHWQQQHMPGVKDIIPAYSSLTIVYDAVSIRKQTGVHSAFTFMKDQLKISIKNLRRKKEVPVVREIPVCYDGSLGIDLEILSDEKKLPASEIIQLHSNKIYRVYMIGFLPGFAYLGKVDEQISTSRKANPRTLVPAGSVGIAGSQTGIYPFDSPGGWNIIGQTPLRMFDARQNDPSLLHAGDHVKFIPVTLKEFHQFKKNS